MHSTSRVLLDVYGDVWEKAVHGYESPIPVRRFEEILKDLYWVDWKHADLLDDYSFSGSFFQELRSEFGLRKQILNG